jgi:hypothetical protein
MLLDRIYRLENHKGLFAGKWNKSQCALNYSHSILVETHPGQHFVALIVESSTLYTSIFLDHLKYSINSPQIMGIVLHGDAASQPRSRIIRIRSIPYDSKSCQCAFASTDRHEEVDRA